MSIEGQAVLELFWQGRYVYKNNQVEYIKIDSKDAIYDIFAEIDKTLPDKYEQQLNFKLTVKIQRVPPKECQAIAAIEALLVTMKVFVFTRSNDIEQLHPVPIDAMPRFEPNKTYQMRIINSGEEFVANIERKKTDLEIRSEKINKAVFFLTRWISVFL